MRNFYSRPFIFWCLCLTAFGLYVILLAAGPQRAGQRIVAIGDIHGDLEAFTGILERAHLLDGGRRWSGGRSILVQTGDFLDRGPDARGVMDLLMSLEKEAERQGGRVVVLMGNHEAMNIFGDLRYVPPEELASFPDRCEAFGPRGKYGKWLRTLPAIEKIGDTIFLHGGISPELREYSVDKLNEAIATEIRAFDRLKAYMVEKKIAQPCDTLDRLTSAARAALEKMKGRDADLLKAFLSYGGWLSVNDNGPLWFRGYAQWPDEEGALQIQTLIEAFGVARFVVGHTPQAGGMIVSRFDGKVYLIDTGMLSTHYPGGGASAWSIQDGRISFIY